jgi:ribonuclease E
MANKMLIDATHPEETRVVVVRGSRVEEFDFESQNRKPLRGNIYLAKVTRVEPSLQAAFVDYGGNRHGFLAFNEIHPDYYQIPVADRQALIAEETRAAKAAEVAADERDRNRPKRAEPAETISEPATGEPAAEGEQAAETGEAAAAEAAPTASNGGGESHEEHPVESVGAGGDALEEIPERQQHRRQRHYKIQDVIKRRQIMLVQVVKEERGTKGAALTTYLSLAGRYSVLMPNTARGGGISRKITAAPDRKRLKTVVEDLEVPEGMGIILRTAGASRTKTEIKRDFEYLLRLWETVRELTLKSTAPALVYEEGSLVKRAIRDLYNKDIDEVLVAGDEAHKEAKDFMRMLMPSHAKNVKPFKDTQPIFVRYGVEHQLDAMFSPIVQLKSGGYVVMNPTEALVAIDVNSGRATREHHIEDTALRTNMEAADEIARQLRLRDLAGLIVIDFIDMEEKRNNRSVERKMKEALKNDRARIQVGHISHFGLLEMSRQRIRTGVLESSTEICPHCAGTGRLRSVASVALQLLRTLEDTLVKSASNDLIVRTRSDVALYVLNQKRGHLREIEARFGVTILISADATLAGQQYYAIERGGPARGPVLPPPSAKADAVTSETEPEVEPEIEDEAEAEAEEAADEETPAGAQPVHAHHPEAENGGRRRRRRGRRGRRGGQGPEHGLPRPFDAGSFAGPTVESATFADQEEAEEIGAHRTQQAVPGVPGEAPQHPGEGGPSPEGAGRRRRRRGRRGGRRNRRNREGGFEQGGPTPEGQIESPMHEGEAHAAMPDTAPQPEFHAPRIEPQRMEPQRIERPAPVVPIPEPVAETPPLRRGSTVREPAPVVRYDEAGAPAFVPATPTPPPAPEPAPEAQAEPDQPRRSGWWRR